MYTGDSEFKRWVFYFGKQGYSNRPILRPSNTGTMSISDRMSSVTTSQVEIRTGKKKVLKRSQCGL